MARRSRQIVLSSLLAVACLAGGCIGGPGPTDQATPFNSVLGDERPAADFRNAHINASSPVLIWRLPIPWSRSGLGGGDTYSGTIGAGMPASGGALPPGRVAVGTDRVVALESLGMSRLYCPDGELLGQRSGVPIGFLADGALITASPLAAYAPDGSQLWQADPARDAQARLISNDDGQLRGTWEGYVSPQGLAFVMVNLERAEEAPMCALVVYDRDGEVTGCVAVPCSVNLLFSPEGTVFSTGIPVPGGIAYREFRVEGTAFILRDTVIVPSGTLYAVGRERTFVVRSDSETQQEFVVYRQGSGHAVSFALPAGEASVAWDSDGLVYSLRNEPKQCVITCWRWPLPAGDD